MTFFLILGGHLPHLGASSLGHELHSLDVVCETLSCVLNGSVPCNGRSSLLSRQPVSETSSDRRTLPGYISRCTHCGTGEEGCPVTSIVSTAARTQRASSLLYLKGQAQHQASRYGCCLISLGTSNSSGL
jgi:hypothetical protein